MAKTSDNIWGYSRKKQTFDNVESNVYNYFDNLYVNSTEEVISSNGSSID
jgi:hypothetical protein